MAALKASVNLFAFLDSDDPGEKRLTDFDAAKANEKETAAKAKPKKPASESMAKNTKQYPTASANLTKDLFGKAYPSARDFIIRQRQLDNQAKANDGVSSDGKNAGASADNKGQVDGAKRGGYGCNEPSRKQQPGVPVKEGAALATEAPPAPVPAPSPSLDNISQFPSFK